MSEHAGSLNHRWAKNCFSAFVCSLLFFRFVNTLFFQSFSLVCILRCRSLVLRSEWPGFQALQRLHNYSLNINHIHHIFFLPRKQGGFTRAPVFRSPPKASRMIRMTHGICFVYGHLRTFMDIFSSLPQSWRISGLNTENDEGTVGDE